MSQIDPEYYHKFTTKSDPHFCTACQAWHDDKSMLGYDNYSAWVNYGMCEACMRHFLGFDNGLIINDQRKRTLFRVLSSDPVLRRYINIHFRHHHFQDGRDGRFKHKQKLVCLRCGTIQRLSVNQCGCGNVMRIKGEG